jgi:LmbE family N-acetylglucosaminyl deacetylase
MKLLFSLCFAILILGSAIQAQDKPLRIIAIFAHPDDADFKMGGTAAMWAEMGHEVKFVSITNGDAGHHKIGGGPLANRRRAETQEVVKRLGIKEYKVLDNHDAELYPALHIRQQVIREIRNWNADIVLGLRTNDYHPDHRYAGVLVMDAAYMVVVPNVTPDTPPLENNPVFLYMQDGFERPYPFQHDITVAIDSHFEIKMYGLDAHESQVYEWNAWVAGFADQVPADKTERFEWLKRAYGSWMTVSPEARKSLEKWYGAEKAAYVKYAESFEIAEYGRQPTEAEIRQIFPMLGN